MTRSTVILSVAVALVVSLAALGHAASRRPLGPILTAVRICSGSDQDLKGECTRSRSRLEHYPEVRCSTRVYAPHPTRFTARILYEGQLERSYSLSLNGRRTRAIVAMFPTLGDVPGGRYSCEFTLGRAHASVTGTSGGPRTSVRGAAACPAYGTGSRVCDEHEPDFYGHAIACSVVLVKMKGHVATTQLQRQDGPTWTTLYAAKDDLGVPIAEVWAYTSADFRLGDYRCRFLVDGDVVAEKPFALHN
jgi:hypothetical protein